MSKLLNKLHCVSTHLPDNLSDFLVWKQMQNVEKKNKAEYYCDCQLLVCISLLYNVSDILWPIYPISK